MGKKSLRNCANPGVSRDCGRNEKMRKEICPPLAFVGAIVLHPSEAYKHRLGLEANTPNLLNPVLNLVFEGDNVGCLRSPAVYQG